MRLAIVGAGAAGLAAARALRQSRPDIAVAVYEKSRGLGGRSATRRRDGFTFDHGAQVIKAPTEAVRRLLLEELPAADLLPVERPVWVFDAAGAVAPGDPQLNAEPSYAYRDGNSRLGKLLAEGLDVRREVRVGRLGALPGGGYELFDVSGAPLGPADAVLLTAPAAQSAEIVAASGLGAELGERVAAELGRASYRRCVSLALAYPRPLERPFYGLINADRGHPLAWLGLEHAKVPGRCPPGHSLLVAQMGPRWSAERWDVPAEEAGREAAAMASAILGEDLREPLWCDRQGWRYALPDSGCAADGLADAEGLFFAGDFTAGQGRVHLAIESGWRAAERVAARLA